LRLPTPLAADVLLLNIPRSSQRVADVALFETGRMLPPLVLDRFRADVKGVAHA
jgi:hypothetical protein